MNKIPVLDKIYLSNTWIIKAYRDRKYSEDIEYVNSAKIERFITGVEDFIGSETVELVDGYDEIKELLKNE